MPEKLEKLSCVIGKNPDVILRPLSHIRGSVFLRPPALFFLTTCMPFFDTSHSSLLLSSQRLFGSMTASQRCS
jgi:hypothetical protein